MAWEIFITLIVVTFIGGWSFLTLAAVIWLRGGLTRSYVKSQRNVRYSDRSLLPSLVGLGLVVTSTLGGTFLIISANSQMFSVYDDNWQPSSTAVFSNLSGGNAGKLYASAYVSGAYTARSNANLPPFDLGGLEKVLTPLVSAGIIQATDVPDLARDLLKETAGKGIDVAGDTAKEFLKHLIEPEKKEVKSESAICNTYVQWSGGQPPAVNTGEDPKVTPQKTTPKPPCTCCVKRPKRRHPHKAPVTATCTASNANLQQ